LKQSVAFGTKDLGDAGGTKSAGSACCTDLANPIFFPQPKPATQSFYTMRRPPNILITGTPGTGKSSLAESLQHNFDGLTHLNISEIIKERKLGESHNSEWDTWEFDDDKVYLY